MPQLSVLLHQIDSGTLMLPEFQRGYVWNRDQVRGLMRSLYRGYPVGSLLLWETDADAASVRGEGGGGGVRLLLLDGQQRITSLYGVMRGAAPPFFDGDPATFRGLYFNLADEAFEFYAPTKMAGDPSWISVTELFREGPEPIFGRLAGHTDFGAYANRITRLHGIKERDFHEEKITGDRPVEDVVDIFNRVNQSGTTLSKGDLSLAKICATWPEARSTMRSHLDRWKEAGFDFKLDWLLRNTTAVATGRAPFSTLEGISAASFEQALGSSVNHIDRFLNTVSGRLGLDHNRVLMGRYAFPVVSRLLHQSGGTFADAAEQDKVLFWYVNAALWGRYTGSTETVLDQDYRALAQGGIEGLIAALERWRGGNLRVGDYDFAGFGRGSRFYPLLYLLTRVRGARDLCSGLPLHAAMLGRLSGLQVHHVFPKAVLYEAGYGRNEVNALANFCFLTQDCNLEIGRRLPEDYFPQAEGRHSGVLASQWLPDDSGLWRVDRYRDFLDARRRMLAEAANSFLTELRTGTGAPTAPHLQPVTVASEDPDEVDTRTAQVKDLADQVVALGCVEPEFDTEIADPETGRALAVAEAHWPDGLQPGQGPPVVLELDPGDTNLNGLSALGYEIFTSTEALLDFVRRRNTFAAGDTETAETV